jgi:hypothetical protein
MSYTDEILPPSYSSSSYYKEVERDLLLDRLIKHADNWLWRNIPSAVGYHFGLSIQDGFVYEGGIIPVEILYLFNWRSGQISIVYTAEGFAYGGTPTVLGVNGYSGFTEIYGLSNNKFVNGYSIYNSGNLSADAYAGFGLSKNSGYAIQTNPLSVFIDPGSGLPVVYKQNSVSFGGNYLSNGIDFGITMNLAYSFLFANVGFPNWLK